jgi:hypothetical protein
MTSSAELSSDAISGPPQLQPLFGNLRLLGPVSSSRLIFFPLPFSHLKLLALPAFLQASNFRFFPLALGRVPQSHLFSVNLSPFLPHPFGSFSSSYYPSSVSFGYFRLLRPSASLSSALSGLSQLFGPLLFWPVSAIPGSPFFSPSTHH